MPTKREIRLKKAAHQLESKGGGGSWARRQAARRHNRRKKSVKSGYTM